MSNQSNILALPPHEEPNFLDLVGYGKDYDEKHEEMKRKIFDIRLAMDEIVRHPIAEFRWQTIYV